MDGPTDRLAHCSRALVLALALLFSPPLLSHALHQWTDPRVLLHWVRTPAQSLGMGQSIGVKYPRPACNHRWQSSSSNHLPTALHLNGNT